MERSLCIFICFSFLCLSGVIVDRRRQRIRRRKGRGWDGGEGGDNLAIPRLYGETPHTVHIACQYFWSAARTLLWSPSILPQRRDLCARVA